MLQVRTNTQIRRMMDCLEVMFLFFLFYEMRFFICIVFVGNNQPYGRCLGCNAFHG